MLEYRSNYSDKKGSLLFNSKFEATDFGVDIVNNDDFISFNYKSKISRDIEAHGVNGTWRKTAITVSLKHVSNF